MLAISCLIGATAATVTTKSDPAVARHATDGAVVLKEAELSPTPVVGRDGQLIRCDDGQLLMVDPGDVPPSTVGETDVRANGSVEVTDPAVPRCGPEGGGADSDPVWVPESVGAGEVDAPPSYARAQR